MKIPEKKETTMGSDNKNKGWSFSKKKRSGMTQFIYTPDELLEYAKTQVI